MIRLQVIAIFAAFAAANKFQEKIFSKKNLEITGTLAVPERTYKAGKLSLALAWLLSLIQAFGLNLRLFALPPKAEIASLLLFYAGLAVTLSAYIHLGAANKIGLPSERTELKTGGIYAFGRNPLYSGLFLILAASCLYTANLLTLLPAAKAVSVYHKITLAEEAFLARRFGAEYEEYRRRVRRYFLF